MSFFIFYCLFASLNFGPVELLAQDTKQINKVEGRVSVFSPEFQHQEHEVIVKTLAFLPRTEITVDYSL